MDLYKKRVAFFITMILAGSSFVVFYLIMTGNGIQVYTDVVTGTSALSSNKSVERNLVFLLICTGLVIYSIYFICSVRRNDKETIDVDRGGKDDVKILLCYLGSMAGVSYFVSAYVNPILTAFLIIFMVILGVDKTLVMYGFVFYYMGVYAIYGLYRMYVFAGGEQPLNNMTIAFVMAIAEVVILLVFKNKKKVLQRCCLMEQLLIPMILLVYLASKYMYHGEMLVIPVPRAVKILTFSLIVLFLLEAVFIMKKNWQTMSDVKNIISFGSCVCIMTFNRFSGSGAVISSDTHHPFENIIGYSQIFELGQKPFSEYIPVSGMYSIIQGAVFKFFGYGQAGNYHITQNVFYLLAILCVIALLRAQASKICVFFVSLIFFMIDYNRIVFILPIMLLLTLPKLIERRNLWLKAWFLTSLFHGLYYPLFGAAVCVAFLPLGIWQIATYIRTGQLKSDIHTGKFWAGWSICVISAVVCMPCLWGTYKHMKAMAGQTIYADGISRFGSIVPDWFFSYLNNGQGIRIALYDIFSFMIPTGFVWLAFALALKIAGVSVENNKLKINNPQGAAVTVSLVIMPAVSFSSTVVRLDIGDLYARSKGPLLIGTVMLLVILEQYLNRDKIKYFVICAAIFVPAVVNYIGFYYSDEKLSAYVAVPEDYKYIENDAVEKLGTGFLAQGMYDSIASAHMKFSGEDKEQSYFGQTGYFGFFYLNNIKGDGTMELQGTVKGYEAAQEAIDIIKKNETIIGTDANPLHNYYMYHWLLTSGEYIWSEEKECFLPNNGSMEPEKVREKHKNLTFSWDGLDVGKNAGSFGMSMDSLREIFTVSNTGFTVQQADNGLQIDFAEAIQGDDADYMYLEFSEMDQNYQYTLFQMEGEQEQDGGALAKCLMKKNYNPGMQVCISWQDENGEMHTINADMNRGKLLMPLGSGVKWLLHKHSFVQVSVMQDGQEIASPQVVDIQFLKLREVG